MIESTNNWTIKNYREIPYYDAPFAMMDDPDSIVESKLNKVLLDLYDGSVFKTKVSYFAPNDATSEEAEMAVWDAINRAKTDYLQERYG